jgi:hypothetical protein
MAVIGLWARLRALIDGRMQGIDRLSVNPRADPARIVREATKFRSGIGGPVGGTER